MCWLARDVCSVITMFSCLAWTSDLASVGNQFWHQFFIWGKQLLLLQCSGQQQEPFVAGHANYHFQPLQTLESVLPFKSRPWVNVNVWHPGGKVNELLVCSQCLWAWFCICIVFAVFEMQLKFLFFRSSATCSGLIKCYTGNSTALLVHYKINIV